MGAAPRGEAYEADEVGEADLVTHHVREDVLAQRSQGAERGVEELVDLARGLAVAVAARAAERATAAARDHHQGQRTDEPQRGRLAPDGRQRAPVQAVRLQARPHPVGHGAERADHRAEAAEGERRVAARGIAHQQHAIGGRRGRRAQARVRGNVAVRGLLHARGTALVSRAKAEEALVEREQRALAQRVGLGVVEEVHRRRAALRAGAALPFERSERRPAGSGAVLPFERSERRPAGSGAVLPFERSERRPAGSGEALPDVLALLLHALGGDEDLAYLGIELVVAASDLQVVEHATHRRAHQVEARVRAHGAGAVEEQAGGDGAAGVLTAGHVTQVERDAAMADAVAGQRVVLEQLRAGGDGARAQRVEEPLGIDHAVEHAAHAVGAAAVPAHDAVAVLEQHQRLHLRLGEQAARHQRRQLGARDVPLAVRAADAPAIEHRHREAGARQVGGVDPARARHRPARCRRPWSPRRVPRRRRR